MEKQTSELQVKLHELERVKSELESERHSLEVKSNNGIEESNSTRVRVTELENLLKNSLAKEESSQNELTAIRKSVLE